LSQTSRQSNSKPKQSRNKGATPTKKMQFEQSSQVVQISGDTNYMVLEKPSQEDDQDDLVRRPRKKRNVIESDDENIDE